VKATNDDVSLVFQLYVIYKNHEDLFLNRSQPSQNVIDIVNDSLLIVHELAKFLRKEKFILKNQKIKNEMILEVFSHQK
jgi:hypothetical protein